MAAVALAPSPWAMAWRRLRRHPGFLFGMAVVLFFVLAALFAPLIAGHDPLSQELARRMRPPVWQAGG
ncbi:MAG: ABC transporter permease, partial [Beijerinckiaceae bacterium]